MKKLLLILLSISSIVSFSQGTCATATNITANGTLTTAAYGTSTYSSGCQPTKTGIKAIWYKFTATANGEITISSDLTTNNGTTFTNDTRISVFKGTCTALTCLEFNDDVSATNFKSTVIVPVAAGSTYYIEWDNYWNVGTATENLPLNFTFAYNAASCIKLDKSGFYLPNTYTTTSVNVFWNQAIGSPANYDTDWSTDFAAPAGSGTIVSTSTFVAGPPAYAYSPISAAPVSSNVRYYVRSNCGGSQSSWQGPNYAYLAKTLPFSHTFEDAAKNFTDGFIGFTRFTSSATSNPANYADGGVGNSMYTFSSTTAVSNLRAYSRAVSLQAGEQVTINFKSRLYSAGVAAPISFNFTVGTAQSAAGQATIIQGFTESSTASYTQNTTTWTAPTAGIYFFGIHNNTPIATAQTFLFLDTFDFTSLLSTNDVVFNKFSIYPNPVKNSISISNSENINVKSVSISDLNGRVIKTENFSNVSDIKVNVSDLSSGMYLMNINSDLGVVTKKIVKE